MGLQSRTRLPQLSRATIAIVPVKSRPSGVVNASALGSKRASLAALPMLRVGRAVESLTFKSRPAPAREPETNEKCGRDGEH
jgi:hypothetical protein